MVVQKRLVSRRQFVARVVRAVAVRARSEQLGGPKAPMVPPPYRGRRARARALHGLMLKRSCMEQTKVNLPGLKPMKPKGTSDSWQSRGSGKQARNSRPQ